MGTAYETICLEQPGSVAMCAFDPNDDNLVLSACADGSARIWDLQMGQVSVHSRVPNAAKGMSVAESYILYRYRQTWITLSKSAYVYTSDDVATHHHGPTMSKKSDGIADRLRAFGLTYPGAHIKSPWPSHKDLAVDDKTFAYLSVPGKPFSISCKLKNSCKKALKLPFTSPTGYGLGKWGWVTASSEKGDIPIDLFEEWIDESYRSQAKKKLVRELDAMLEE